MRKILVIAFLMSLALVVAACGGNSGGNNKPAENKGGKSGNTSSTNTEKKEEKAKAPMKISIMTALHSAEVPDSKIEEIIEEKLNVDLDIQWIPASTFGDRMTASFATGNLPHVSNISLRGANREAIIDGQFWEIGPLLDNYENLKNLKKEVLQNTAVEGKTYALYQGRPLSRQGLIYRKDWADQLGLSEPTNLDELYNMLEQFTLNDPDGNGSADTLGLADRGDLNSGAFKTLAAWNGAPNEWGIEDGKLKPWFEYPEYVEAMDFMKKLRENGYINSDFPVTSKTDQQNMLSSGKAGAYIGCMCDVQTLYTAGVQLNPDINFDVHNRIAGYNGEFAVQAGTGLNHPYLFPKSAIKTEEELHEVLTFMDGMMSEEISNLLFWGIEGEHYNVEEGFAVPIEDQGKLDREVKPYNTIEIGDAATNGRYDGKPSYAAAYKAQELFVDNDNIVVHDPTVTLESETQTKHKDRLDQIIKDATYNYILGQLDLDGFNKEVDRWKNEGGSQMIEEFSDSYAKTQ